jgi:hypothetical protein
MSQPTLELFVIFMGPHKVRPPKKNQFKNGKTEVGKLFGRKQSTLLFSQFSASCSTWLTPRASNFGLIPEITITEQLFFYNSVISFICFALDDLSKLATIK